MLSLRSLISELWTSASSLVVLVSSRDPRLALDYICSNICRSSGFERSKWEVAAVEADGFDVLDYYGTGLVYSR